MKERQNACLEGQEQQYPTITLRPKTLKAYVCTHSIARMLVYKQFRVQWSRIFLIVQDWVKSHLQTDNAYSLKKWKVLHVEAMSPY